MTAKHLFNARVGRTDVEVFGPTSKTKLRLWIQQHRPDLNAKLPATLPMKEVRQILDEETGANTRDSEFIEETCAKWLDLLKKKAG